MEHKQLNYYILTLVNGKFLSRISAKIVNTKKCYIFIARMEVVRMCVCFFFWSLTMIRSKPIQIELDDLIHCLHARCL